MASKVKIAELLVEIGVDAKDAEKAASRIKDKLKEVGKAGEKADKGVTKGEKALKRFAKAGDAANKVANGIGVALASVGAVVGGLAKEVLGTGASFEKLRAQLKTATGSAEGARKALDFIKDFAKNTPFQVDQITDAFIKLKNRGLDPTERTLTAFGDFASAMGKDLDQFIEAVLDATTGEFERLKDFGVTTKTEGDRVALTFKGITTTVGKNAKEIQEFLTNLAEQNFGGAMSDQMETAGGLISNLQDTWTEFLDTVANLGPLDEFKLLLDDLKDAAGGRNGLAKQLAGVLVKAIKGVRRLLKGNLIPTLERLLSVIEFVVNNFGKLAAVFAAGKVISGVASLATAFGGLGISIAALTGPVGIALAALAALGIAAVAVGRQINSIPKIPPPPGPTIDERDIRLAPRTAPAIRAKQKELQALRRRIAGNPALDIFEVRQQEAGLVREIGRLNEQRREEQSARSAASLAASVGATSPEEQARRREAFSEVQGLLLKFSPVDKGTGALSDETSRGLALARETIIGGGSVEDALSAIADADVKAAEAGGFGIVGKREGADTSNRKARAAKKKADKERKKKRVTSPTTVSEFFSAAARGDLGKIADRTPSTRDIEPTVAVDITNNNIKVDNKFNITGKGDAGTISKSVAKEMEMVLGRIFSNAGNQIPNNGVR